jgi:hypothetical protein
MAAPPSGAVHWPREAVPSYAYGHFATAPGPVLSHVVASACMVGALQLSTGTLQVWCSQQTAKNKS